MMSATNLPNNNHHSHQNKSITCFKRINCGCEATYHALVANCLNCGRIVCSQEGEGPCFSCTENVISMEKRRELEIQKESNIDSQFLNAMKVTGNIVSQTKSLKYLKLYDDELDYFGANSWLSAEERKINQQKVEELKEEHDNRANRMPLFDLMNWGVVEQEEENFYQKLEEKHDQDLKESNVRADNNVSHETFNQYVKRFENALGTSYVNQNSNSQFALQKQVKRPKPSISPGQMAEELSTDDSPIAFSLAQPLASAVCWLQALKFMMPIQLKYEGPVWIVSSEIYDELLLDKKLVKKLTRFLNEHQAKKKHILGRIFVSCSIVNEETLVEVKDAQLLNYEIPYDDKDRKYWDLEQEVMNALLKQLS